MRATTRASAVIGAGYGDEGKGLMIDALAAAAEGAVVVRFNGGAQAGHTVVSPDGRRHVFHHVGSGSFAGAGTHLSRFFVSNPLLLGTELADLAALGVRPEISADPHGLLTTPFDMMLNQFAEEARGAARHGSCGVGFGETIERGLHGRYRTTLDDLRDPPALAAKLELVRTEWMPRRLTKLGISSAWLNKRDLIFSDRAIPGFMEAATAFSETVGIRRDEDLAGAPDVVFEGAQGLMLDQDRGAFPHVTRSNTGLKNVLALCGIMGIGSLQAFYATRCYVTRHGAGPLAHALNETPQRAMVDETNVPNDWQGTLRFAELDVDVLAEAIRADLSDVVGSGINVRHSMAVTCLDQAQVRWNWFMNGVRCGGTPEAAAHVAATTVRSAALQLSYGPTRTTFQVPVWSAA
jgi:adenylosuccinate synthase